LEEKELISVREYDKKKVLACTKTCSLVKIVIKKIVSKILLGFFYKKNVGRINFFKKIFSGIKLNFNLLVLAPSKKKNLLVLESIMKKSIIVEKLVV